MRCYCCDTEGRTSYDRKTKRFYCNKCRREFNMNYNAIVKGDFTLQDLERIILGDDTDELI